MDVKIPRTMMTQHPDSATRYVSIQEEPEEAVSALLPPPDGFGVEEVMVDFEGKLTPYHQTAQVVNGLFDEGMVPGRDVLVTPRVASATQETTFKQLMALLSVVETNYLARERHSVPAVVEVVLPMVESADEVLFARRRIEHVVQLAHDEFGIENDKNAISVIPLIEEIPQLVGLHGMFTRYVDLCRAEGFKVDRLRYMLARSDPALSYGLVSAVLANKVALARGYELERERGVTPLPILGAGSLPFRGHITPGNIENILAGYGGVRTITIQSGLRYDHPKEKVLEMISTLNTGLQATPPLEFTEEEFERIVNLIGVFTKCYVESFLGVIEQVCRVSDLIPRQRDRLARKSTVGYARDIARPGQLAAFVTDTEVRGELQSLDMDRKVELPRAISFTAALYTIGYPPEFLGTGRGLRRVKERYGEAGIKDLRRFYPSLATDLEFAGRYLHMENAERFFPDDCVEMMRADVRGASEILGLEFAPKGEDDEQHRTLMEVVAPVLRQLTRSGASSGSDLSVVTECITRMGRIRGSLG